jgi:hypothetical protein
MSKHWRMLLGATLAVTNPAGMAIVAFAQPEAHDAINQALAQQGGTDTRQEMAPLVAPTAAVHRTPSGRIVPLLPRRTRARRSGTDHHRPA